MNALEVVLGVSGALVTGGVGWWARYVTSGASKAHKLTDTVLRIEQSIDDHETREEKKFEALGAEMGGLRETVGELIGSVGELHGKVDSLTVFLGVKPKG